MARMVAGRLLMPQPLPLAGESARRTWRKLLRRKGLAMDAEDFLSKRPESLLAQLRREDLDRLSVDELGERIATLEAEIARTKAKRDSASAFRSAADSLFKK
ncbi:DUF1192 domain-containing protein [Sandaracinobacteroides hominis]|uniref:DUF1192 domain-containing protein n=1 Tax=Sandaracinobacteroides hominis TaxID=2780086 RepID=UPI002E27ABB2|nr:DUF1192 domain-containing protein [Sandaracinobacteroides hominis]